MGLAFLDELWSGVPVVDAPQIEHELGLAHGATALAVLTLPTLAGALLEARLILWASRGDARRWIAAGQAVLCGCALTGAVAASPWTLALALAIASPASGVAVSLGLASLAEAHARGRERMLLRWTLSGALGDVAAPLAVALVAWAGLPWRAALVVVAVLVGAHAIAILRSPALAASAELDDATESVPIGRVLRAPRLLLWLLGLTTCALLDEILVAFAALRLRQSLGASEAFTAIAIAACSAGAAAGLLVTERALTRVSPRAALVAVSIGSALACGALVVAPSPLLAAVALFVLGVISAPLYPLAKARAFAACPGRAAHVEVAGQLFAPIDIALPWLVGLLADAAGLELALAALLLQPLTLLVLALFESARD